MYNVYITFFFPLITKCVTFLIFDSHIFRFKKFLIENYSGYNFCVYLIICDVIVHVLVKKPKLRSSQKSPDKWYTSNLSIHQLNNETVIEVYLESILVPVSKPPLHQSRST